MILIYVGQIISHPEHIYRPLDVLQGPSRMVCFPTTSTVVLWSHLQPLSLTPLSSLWPPWCSSNTPGTLPHQDHGPCHSLRQEATPQTSVCPPPWLPPRVFAQRLLLIEPSLTTTSSSLSHAQTPTPLAYFIFFHSIGHIIYFTVICCLHTSSVKLRIFFCFVHCCMPSNANRAWQKVGT